MFFGEIFKKLNEYKVKHLIIGGAAVNLHGFIRVTNDLDMFIFLDEENVEKFSKAMKELKYAPKIPVEISDLADENKLNSWIKEKNMKVFSLVNPDTDAVIDVMIAKYIDFKKAYENKKIVNVAGIDVPIVSISDLIKLKEIAGRAQDIMDIKLLSKIMERQEVEKQDERK